MRDIPQVSTGYVSQRVLFQAARLRPRETTYYNDQPDMSDDMLALPRSLEEVEQHILRTPAGEWPDPVNRAFKHLNPKVYIPMQRPSELGASGKLADERRVAL